MNKATTAVWEEDSIMEHLTSYIFLLPMLTSLFFPSFALSSSSSSSCSNKCGSLDVRYPFGTGSGCGSPHFFPSITCISSSAADDSTDVGEHLTLTTHTGTYPVSSISYSTSTLTISPPLMSTCSDMHAIAATPSFGLDWSAPFQLDSSSVFILLGCPAPTTALSSHGNLVCDPAAGPLLCGPLHQCPAVVSLGLPLLAPTNTCCVYSPASLDPKGGDLDLLFGFRCAAYSSVTSLGQMPMYAGTWQYGIALKYQEAEIAGEGVMETCSACERSGGVCGYAMPKNYFVCVCERGVNTSFDCAGQSEVLKDFWHSTGSFSRGHGIIGWNWMLVVLGCWWGLTMIMM